MKKILGILFFGLLLSINVYADDQYSETNRKKSNIKLSCKIDIIYKYANQDGLHASKYDTSDLPKIINNPDLPGIIIETNLNSRPVWINKVAAKAEDNWREKLQITRFEQANEKDFVVIRNYTIDYTKKGENNQDYHLWIETSMHQHKNKFKDENSKTINVLEVGNEDIYNYLIDNRFFEPISSSDGGCNKIELEDFANEEKRIFEEIKIAEKKKKKQKDLISKKKETLKKERIAEGKFELNCKNGAFVNPSTGEVISTFTDEMNYLINVNDYTYQNLNSKNNKIHQFMNGGVFLLFYRFDSTTVQFASYNKNAGILAFITHTSMNELSKYKEIKSQFDEINKRIPNYKAEIGLDGEEIYNVSTELGNKEFNENSDPSSVEFLEFAKLDILVNYLQTLDIKAAKYECNKIPALN